MNQAKRCELALDNRCRCRCGGLLHGVSRGTDTAFFESLPADDPHRAIERRPPVPGKRRGRPRKPLPLLEGL